MNNLIDSSIRRPNDDEFALFLGSFKSPEYGLWFLMIYDGISVKKLVFNVSPIWGVLVLSEPKTSYLDINEIFN